MRYSSKDERSSEFSFLMCNSSWQFLCNGAGWRPEQPAMQNTLLNEKLFITNIMESVRIRSFYGPEKALYLDTFHTVRLNPLHATSPFLYPHFLKFSEGIERDHWHEMG